MAPVPAQPRDFPGQAYLCFLSPHDLEARTFSSRKITTCFLAILALSWWFGPEPAVSPRSACPTAQKGLREGLRVPSGQARPRCDTAHQMHHKTA